MLRLLLLLLLRLPSQTFIRDLSPGIRPFRRDFPHPPVARRVANRQEPEQRALTKDVKQIATPAEIESIGQFLAVLFVEVGSVAVVFALGFHRGVGLAEV
jgi:hypothetical protein